MLLQKQIQDAAAKGNPALKLPGSQGLQYYKKWNLRDLKGKYHAHKFEEKDVPVPGTQVLDEIKSKETKEADVAAMNNFIASTEENCEQRTKIRRELAKVSTKVAFSTTIGEPIRECDSVQREKQVEIERSKTVILDPMPQILKFMKYVRLGRVHYIGYAVTLGFKSINYAEEDTGNTALHISVHRADVACVEELLKYRAIPEIKNRLGNCPIHDCWIFWKTHYNRTKEERLDQESKTVKMVHHLLSYNAYVDGQDQNGDTALHYACRLGPTKAVMLILGFQPNINIRNKANKVPLDVAMKHGRKEVVTVLQQWPNISKHYVKSDFVVLWKKFIGNRLAVISDNLSAEEVVFQLTMATNLKTIGQMKLADSMQNATVTETDERGVSVTRKCTAGLVPIDDDLWRKTYTDGRNFMTTPKPWEASAWDRFKDEMHSKGITSPWEGQVDLKKCGSKLAIIAAAREKAAKKAEFQGKFPDKEPPERISAAIENARQNKLKKLKAANAADEDEAESFSGATKGIACTSVDSSTSSTSATIQARPFSSSNAEGGEKSIPNSIPNTARHSSLFQSNDEMGEVPDGPDNIPVLPMSVASNDSHEIFDQFDDLMVGGGSMAMPPQSDAAAGGSAAGSRPRTKTERRRSEIAHAVSLDGKFVAFTKRPTTGSPLWLPLRRPEAPLYGTPEQGSIMRIIASQGKDFDLVARTKKVNIYEKLGVKENPAITPIGVYCEAVEFGGSSERDRYLHCVTGTVTSENGSARVGGVDTAEEVVDGVAAREGLKISTVDMVLNRRKRFVDKALIPPKHANSFLEEAGERERQRKKQIMMEAEVANNKTRIGGPSLEAPDEDPAEVKAKAELLRKIANCASRAGSAVASAMNSTMNSPRSVSGEDKKDDTLDPEVQQLLKQRMKFLQSENVVYGKGRLTSTHNLKGRLVEPWSTVTNNYSTLPGDRTA